MDEKRIQSNDTLSPAAVKVARRIEALPPGEVYHITVTKVRQETIYLAVRNEGHIETIKEN